MTVFTFAFQTVLSMGTPIKCTSGETLTGTKSKQKGASNTLTWGVIAVRRAQKALSRVEVSTTPQCFSVYALSTKTQPPLQVYQLAF